VDIALFRALLTPGGQALLAETAAADVSEAGLLATVSRLRDHPADFRRRPSRPRQCQVMMGNAP
jgi:hypothetical protein